MWFVSTVYYLSAGAAAIEGESGMTRHVVEREANDEEHYKARVLDSFTRHVDDQIWFGPISRREE